MLRTIFIFFLCISLNASAQTNNVHIVDRGETLVSIAERYKTTREKIIELNPDVAQFIYVGMELSIPATSVQTTDNSNSLNISANSDSRLATGISLLLELDEADELLDAKKYNKAVHSYSQIIKQYGPCSDAYYGRGLAYYSQGRWKNAINDFECVIADSECDNNIRLHCYDLLSKASQFRQEQIERRNEALGSIMAATVVAATSVIVANEQAKNANSYRSVQSGNLDYLLDPNYTIQQVNAQNEAEYQQAKRFNPSLTREQFMSMKAQAYYESQKDNSISTSSSSSNSKDYNRSSLASTDCESLRKDNGRWYCGNTGKCGMCGGDGLMDGSFGFGANSLKCSLCNGTGKCKYCNH